MFVDMLNAQKKKPRDLSTLSTGLMAGAPCHQELVMAAIEKLNMKDLLVMYGMTETSPVTFQCFSSDLPAVRSSTVGYPSDHIEVSNCNI
ncbi:medium-chain acyl-CoA ligase ACSF2, mitochondrial-like [Panulirus ornatus]|uniref:medium-chain acyl-CoA ligase ACSF2, mitochondrial-like n=1 Tax=Panulirus ornatus TaxID=150431 RepID=UPI003A864144